MTFAVTIRAARPTDFEALVDLDVASAEHHRVVDPRRYRVPDRRAIAAFLRRRLDEPSSEVLVAEVDGAVVGRLDFGLVEAPDEGSILAPIPTLDIGLSVLPAWRRHGIGRRLMAAAEATARTRGIHRIMLDMHADNESALALYRSLGYREYGLVMDRWLDDVADGSQ
jgi:diamine N-acetyltransferase